MDDGGVRQRFTVELRPGETTIVSWKKLVKDTTAKASTSSPPVVAPMPKINAVLDSPLAQGQPAENELKDGHPSRFTDVIEKIERLYVGKHSSDEEDLNDVPDDDEYDTEDSFIDDTELDDYFQVDNSAIKHDGFFVNRGKLERINEPTSLPNQQPKKRRRKDLANDHSDGDKRVKVGNKAAGKSKKLAGIGLPHVVALPSVHSEEIKFPNLMKTPVISAKKKSTEIKTPMDPSIFSSVSNRDAALSVMGNVNTRGPEMLSSKDVVETANGSVLKSEEKSASTQSMSYGIGELVQSVQEREKDGNPERLDLNVSAGKVPMQNAKAPIGQKKESSIIKPKSTNLEKTIGELEKMVAESRPQSMEVLDADKTFPAVKKRLPREVKQKLAKVARQAQAIHGRIPEELVNRLMSILGHLVQVRTLKRNLKDMVSMGLTLKKEKDDRVQQMKKDIAELIRLRVPYINSKVLEQQASGSDDFQEMGNEEKEFIRRKHGMDNVIEDKICDLYDLYVDGLDEDAGPQARKLYYELAHLWPEGFMDNHGIKRAICRAKNRKRALYGRSKDQEKVKRKKMVSKSEGTVRVDASTVAQPYHTQDRSVSELDNHGFISSNKSVPSPTSTNPSVGVASSTPSEPSLDHPKGNCIDLNEKDPMDVLA